MPATARTAASTAVSATVATAASTLGSRIHAEHQADEGRPYRPARERGRRRSAQAQACEPLHHQSHGQEQDDPDGQAQDLVGAHRSIVAVSGSARARLWPGTRDGTGVLVGATSGPVYVLVNAGALPRPLVMALRVLAVVAYAGLAVVVLRRRGPTGGSGRGQVRLSRGYWVIVGAEVAALFVGDLLLSGPLDRPEAVLPWVTTVVGVHFLPLAGAWWGAVAMTRGATG